MVSKQPQNGFLSSEAGNDEDHEAATTAQWVKISSFF